MADIYSGDRGDAEWSQPLDEDPLHILGRAAFREGSEHDPPDAVEPSGP
jgi:hypothetical protein